MPDTQPTPPDTEWSELHLQLSAHIGRVVQRQLGRISTLACQRFVVAAGTADQSYLAAGPDEAIPVPPLMIPALMGAGAGPAEDQLRADGSDPSDMAGLPLGGRRLMGAGQELEFHRDLLSGCTVTAHSSVHDVELKHGRSGPFIVITMLRRYLDQTGTEVITCHERFFVR